MNKVFQPIVETIIRATSKSPKYFKALQILIAIITAACGALTYIHDNNLLQLPAWTMPFIGVNSMVMGGVAWLLARLPAEKPDAVKAKTDAVLNK